MAPAQILADIPRAAPTGPASASGLRCLLGLAQDGDFEAIRQLVSILGPELGYKLDSHIYAQPRSLTSVSALAKPTASFGHAQPRPR